jgi:hypothetical protein
MLLRIIKRENRDGDEDSQIDECVARIGCWGWDIMVNSQVDTGLYVLEQY